MNALGLHAMGGSPLIGDKLVRVVYIDETGHSRREPVAVVAGVLLDPDRQWRALANQIAALVEECVPAQHRDTFIFHATDLQHGGKYRQTWGDEARWNTLDRLVALPRELKIPLVLGFSKKPEERDEPHRESIITHAMAYGFCIKAADRFMNEQTPPNEVAMLVAEERTEAREAIKATHRLLSNKAMIEQWLPPFMQKDFPISRVKGPPAFASKDDEVLLQIADACAFAFQRFLRGVPQCERLIEAMFGNFAHPASLGAQREAAANYGCFWWPSDGEKASFFRV